MPYQFPLVVRYDDEGQPNGLKESNTISASSVSATDIIVESLSATGDFVVSSISATTIKVNYISAIQELIVSSISAIDWLGLPVAGGAVSITDASVGAIYFRSGDSAVSSIPLPITSGYLFVDYDGINPLYSFEPAVGLSMADLDALSATIASIYVSSSELTGFATTTDISNLSTTIASVYVSSSELTAYATDADITNLSATIASIYVSGSQLDSLATDTELTNSINALSTVISSTYVSSIQLADYATDIELTNSINALSTVISSTYVSASQLAAYATDTELTNSINSLSALISSTYVSSSELSLYATDTDITNLSTTIANNYVSSAGDVMTGFLTFNGSYGIKFEDIAGLGGLSANNKIVFYSPTEGLSAAQIKSYTNETVGVSAPFIATNTSFSGYHYNNTTPNQEVPVATYLRQLDKWLYLHVENYNNPTGDATVGHWSVAGIRDKSLNILSATDASALKDINYPTTPTNGQVLTWENTAWIPKNSSGGASALSGLSDVNIAAAPQYGSILSWDGSKWTAVFTEQPPPEVEEGLGFLFATDPSATSGLDIDEGLLYYNDDTKTLILRSANQTDLKLGQEVSLRVMNQTGTTLNVGTVVYVSGYVSNMPTIALATASSEATTHKGMGILKQTLVNGDRGLMAVYGEVTGIDTSLFSVGDVLYLGITPGSITNLYASAPNHPEIVGTVLVVGASSTGKILAQVQHGYEIQELHNVSRTPASATGQVLVWNNTGGYYAPGSHNDLAGLTTGNPHTQYATLSGCNFTGTVSATTVSATTYQNIPKQVRPISINIENPSANMIIPLFYGEGYIDTINQINSVIIGGTSATWSIYQAADVSNPDDVGNTVLYDTEVTDSTTGGNTHPINVSFSEDWIVLVFKSVSGAISRLHLTVFVS